MRHGRAKAARKTLQFFARTCGIHPPYHVLLDGTLLVAIIKYHFHLRERLDKLLQHAAFTLYTTKSCLTELEQLAAAAAVADTKKEDTVREAIRWAKKECTLVDGIAELEKDTQKRLQHNFPDLLEQNLSPAGWDILKCALSRNDNNNNTSKHPLKYFVASQDENVLDVLRREGTVPCIRLARGSVLLLEQPSKAGQRQALGDEKRKWTSSSAVVSDKERKLVDLAREEQRQQKASSIQPQQPKQQRKKRKAKEPNPLSCKKRATSTANEESPKKRRRRRKGNSNKGDKDNSAKEDA